MQGSNFINAFSYLGDLERVTRRHILYVRVIDILERFELFLLRERKDIQSYKDVVDATLATVFSSFNGNWDSLETYVTNTASKVPIRTKEYSLDKVLGETNAGVTTTLADVVTDRHKLQRGLSAREFLNEVRSSQYIWSDWVDSLKREDLTLKGVTSLDITSVISSVVILDLLDFYAKEELALTALGKLDEDYYTKYYRNIVNKLKKHFKVKSDYIIEKLPLWGAIYLQNRDFFKRQFHYLVTSNLVVYNGTIKERKSTHFMLRDGMITRVEGSNETVRLYKFKYNEVLDKIFDDYFKESGSKLVVEVADKDYFNVLNGIFTDERNLEDYLRTNLKEYILSTISAWYVGDGTEYGYFAIRSKSPNIIIPLYYFGIMFTITLDSCSDFVTVE